MLTLSQTKLLKFSVLQTISAKNLHKKLKNTNFIPMRVQNVEIALAR